MRSIPPPWAATPSKEHTKDHPWEAPNKTTAARRYFGSTHHRERRQNRTGAELFRTGVPPPWAGRGCGPGEASSRGTICWRFSSHERDHIRFDIRPSPKPPLLLLRVKAPAAALDEPAVATPATPATPASPAPATVSAVPAKRVAPTKKNPSYHPPAAEVGMPRVPNTTHCTPITPAVFAHH